MGEFVEKDVILERGRDLHEADVEGNGAIRRAATPARAGVGEADAVVGIAVEFSEVF